jgi:hypothetical protein
VKRSRPVNTRRTRSQMVLLRERIYDVVSEIAPATVRQTFYQLVSRGIIDKTEGEYKHTVIPLLTKMRLSGEIPFDWIADNTRWMRKPKTYSSLEHMLSLSQATYRRALWDDQDEYVEIWLEKDALAGVLYEETAEWDVPLMVTRGYASVSYLYGAAQAIIANDKTTFLYYFGDYDPSGLDISRATEARMREFAGGVDIHFERVAVTKKQITAMGLPTRPTKQTDARSGNFKGESVEVDAIGPNELRRMVHDAIVRHIDEDQLRLSRHIERLERENFETFRRNIRQIGGA